MQLVNIYCGLDTNGAEIDARKVALTLAAKYFPTGHTVVDTLGRYSGQVGIIDEPSILIQVMSASDETAADNLNHAVNLFCDAYKQDANQESVLVTWQQIQAAFV